MRYKFQYEKYMWGMPGAMLPDIPDNFHNYDLLNMSDRGTKDTNYLMEDSFSPTTPELKQKNSDGPLTLKSPEQTYSDKPLMHRENELVDLEKV